MDIINHETKDRIVAYAMKNGFHVGYVGEGFFEFPLDSEYICVYDESFKKDFDYYNLSYGNIATFCKYDEQNLGIELSSNDYPKEVMRQLKTKYKLECIIDDYDQILAPHWDFHYTIPNESVEDFLDEAIRLKSECSEGRTELEMVYSIAETNLGVHVQLTEKNDWEAFGEVMGEYYHSSVVVFLKERGLKTLNKHDESSFYCKNTKEEVLQILENEDFLFFDESFDEYMKNYRQEYMKDKLI